MNSRQSFFEKKSKDVIYNLKYNILNSKIETDKDDVFLQVVTSDYINDDNIINLLSYWRSKSQHAFLKIFPVTDEGTKRWLKHGVIEREDRILFLVSRRNGDFIGHIGLSSFDFSHNTCEIDNVIKSPECDDKGIFTDVTNFLLKWTKENLGPDKIKLRVFSDNAKALALYTRVGFIPTNLITFKKVIDGEIIEWIESDSNVDRCFLVMEKRI
ncbi:GNAT family N-acetyltransferase [Vibrio sp. MEBiC08052]|uniref:GNAT family N-acetyltransferase n=1 Tax=Vibrio sp. MEBiC08052 TaxID=1761910 RepID=UPI0007406D4C|nr:GNAT family N-acetyltransferase [Vibrio sp. MEBiC08052]KUJ00618.1 hypothetical protein VRK_01200 [Vibrio sp. MEBiC08052]